MKIRYGLVLAMAILFGVTGCASGGGGGGGGTTLADLTAQAGGQGERPRDTENTRAAERALESSDETDDEAERRMFCEQALTSAEAAIAEDGTNPLGHRLAALAALCLEDYQAAGSHFDRAAELRPLYEFEDQPVRERTWIDLYQQAAPLVSGGDYEGAVAVFENANAIYQGRPEAMITLGQLHAQLRNHDQAIENLEMAQAFMSDPENLSVVDSATAAGWQEQAADIPVLRAQVLADAGRYEEATGAFRELIAGDPQNLEYRQGLATMLMQAGNEEEALAVYAELLDQPGLSAIDFYRIGVGFYQASDYGQAANAFGRAAQSAPNNRDALELWARSLQLDSAFAEVPEVTQEWLSLDPNSQNGWLILAQSANQNGDQETTREAVQAVEDLDFAVDQLQLQRYGSGGGVVNGVVINKQLDAGASVTLTFTFYGPNGSPIGTVTETVQVGEADMSELFSVEFDSAQEISGYGYTIG